jgi:protein involved in polysaccharide export with SLBB domain
MISTTRIAKHIRTLACVAAALFAGSAVAPVTTVGAQESNPEGFHAGDRIALTIEGPLNMNDTLVVREGLVLRIPSMADIPLTGVRRADAQKYLTQQIEKYVKNPIVHATPLVRIAVLGEVGHPGFYTMPSDVLLSDVVMRAGGPTGNADLGKTVVKRGSQEVVSQTMARNALSSGETLDDLRVAPGDQVVIGEKSHFGFGTVMQAVSVLASVTAVLFYLGHR